MDSITPLMLATGATAASLLIAVFVFLYNVLRDLRKQYGDDYNLYVKVGGEVYAKLRAKLPELEGKWQTSGRTGTSSEFDFEWRTDVCSGVPFNKAAPDVLYSSLEGLLERIHSETRILFQVSDKPADVLDFKEEKTLSKIIQEIRERDLQSYILFNWVFDPNSKMLYFQSLFLSQLPKRMLEMTNALKRTCYATLLFIISIVLSMSSYSWDPFAILALVTYWSGWFMVTWVVILAFSLIPEIRRRQSRDSQF